VCLARSMYIVYRIGMSIVYFAFEEYGSKL
jgi:hypothetical protein